MSRISALTVSIVILLSGCRWLKDSWDEAGKEDCQYTKRYICLSSKNKVEVTFSRYEEEKRVEKCKTREIDDDVDVKFLMSALFSVRVDDQRVQSDPCEEENPGVQCDFEEKARTYLFDAESREHIIKSNDQAHPLICVLYLVAKVMERPSSDSDFDD